MMSVEALGIDGAWLCTPAVHADPRGIFLEWFRGDRLAAATGRSFEVVQANHSVSAKGVVRGVHYADVPPGQAKYVSCSGGAILDVVVDLRLDSPTYGKFEAMVIDDQRRQGIFIAEGLGHAFCALADQTAVSYLVSATYAPEREHTVSPLDPALGLPWDEHVVGPLSVSDRDGAAPTLAEAAAAGALPTYAACLDRYAALSLTS
ncbi:MAG TPA: dTDP-4-dehydrorhamnose 3,5-epimerase family protein [Mycobacteriales bacterium]|nr:dTDP-4-dehydrorhamnose 3,5-epimerase family protein [Mycobacteriales bacterium]